MKVEIKGATKVEIKGATVREYDNDIVIEDPTEILVTFQDKEESEYSIKILEHSRPDAPEIAILCKYPGDDEYEAIESIIL